MTKKPPGLAHSTLTGNYYFVSSWRPDGSARTKHDITKDVQDLMASADTEIHRLLGLLRKAEEYAPHAPGCPCAPCVCWIAEARESFKLHGGG
jgi:hypothetical protein